MERTFLKRDKIHITSTMANFGDTSYPINNIGAVSTESTNDVGAAIGGFLFLLVMGFIFRVFGFGILGLISWGLAIMVAVTAFITEHHVTLRTSSGNTHAFSSKDKAEVEEVRLAIVKAIASK